MLKKLSIQSKMTLMLLVVSISSILVIAFVGYRSGKAALTQSIFNQLTSLRETKRQEVQTYTQTIQGQVRTLSQDPTLARAMQAYKTAYQELKAKPTATSWQTAIGQYYRDQYIPKLAANVEGRPDPVSYQPKTAAEQYIQYHYVIKSDDFEQKAAVDDPRDGSSYSTWHRQFHPFLRAFVEEFGYEDLFLIDPDTGDVIYTVYKGVDFATNLKDGPFAQSTLAQVYQDIVQNGEPSYLAATDFAPYRPSYSEPAAMMASPIYDQGKMIGIVALQLSAAEINKVMTYDQRWQQVGLGQTGATYLVGPDYLMRSDSRTFTERPERFFELLRAQGYAADQLARIERLGTTILQQEVRVPEVEQALEGKSGAVITQDYLGVPVLNAYAPLNLQHFNWVILAEIDVAEAFAPIREFQKRVLISTVVITLFITLIAMRLAHVFVHPLQMLTQGFRKLEKGDTDTRVNVKTKDEFGELAQSFNEMVQSLRHKTQQVQEKNEENEALLQSILPGPVAQRIKQGEENIADSFSNVTVLFTDLVGFSDLAERVTADEIVTLLNRLVSAFDEAAERHGVEKVKTIGSSYMAVSGLSVPRLDHTKRVMDFAVEMIRIVQRFNQTQQTHLEARVGLNSGPVVAGIIGRSKFIYDLWGDTVNVAYHMQAKGEANAVQVTATVYEQLKGFYDFELKGKVEVGQRNLVEAWLQRA